MTDKEQLIKARNLLRYIFRKMDNEFDVRFRENSGFFFNLMNRCAEIGVIENDNGRYLLTGKESETGYTGKPRHFGKHKREKHTC